MKLIKHRIVGKIEVKAEVVNEGSTPIEHTYRKYWRSRGGGLSGWEYFEDFPGFVSRGLKCRGIYDFTACIVGYEPATDSPKRGMDRRHALGVLNKLGLATPSLLQTVVLASQSIRTNEVLNISNANDQRRVVCPVPFNPESPDFYYFGYGIHDKGSFRRHDYQMIPHEDNLYFWSHDYAHDQGDEVGVSRDLFSYHFPLILGVMY